MARPGIMIYFDTLEPIRVLSDADKGRLLVAMLEYGQSGILPAFDGILALAWEFVKPKIDKDEETYENVKIQRRYAAFCKSRSSKNLPKIPFEEWLKMDDNERQQMATDDNEPLRAVVPVASRYPTTTPTTITTSTTTTTTTPTTETGGERDPFDRFWDIYPNKIGRSDAMATWNDMKPSPEVVSDILESVESWKKSSQWTEDGGRFIPLAANFLGKEYWKSVPVVNKTAKRNTTRQLDPDEIAALEAIIEE